MATFQIFQDAEKENPLNTLKEKTLGVKANKALQPSMLHPVGGAQIVGKQQRSNNAAAVGGSKVAFREVGNFKAAGQKSVVVPVVEQFKAFSVYEDHNEQPKQQHLLAETGAAGTITAASTLEQTTSETDKENAFQQASVVPRTFTDVGHDEQDYLLDATPMSVTDVLSPMSVDRSLLLPGHDSAATLDDSSTSSSKPTADDHDHSLDSVVGAQRQVEQRGITVPRNDRQRFFEVVEYQHEILEYFREAEQKHRPKAHYMRRQSDINYSMRTILVDWLVEVSEEYNLDTETLYLSVAYIDRFLSHMSVVRSKLQLVGTAAMYIASKYEEIYPPDVGEFVFITDDTYNKTQVLRMEQIILKILAFQLCSPTAFVFINTYAVLSDMSDKLKFLTQYICELSLLEADPYLRFLPSMVSAASLAVARHTLGMPLWSREIQELTTYGLHDLREIVLHLGKTHVSAATLAQQAIQDKYKADKYRRVSGIPPLDLSEAGFDELARQYVTHSDDSASHTTTAQNSASNNEHVRRMISQMFN